MHNFLIVRDKLFQELHTTNIHSIPLKMHKRSLQILTAFPIPSTHYQPNKSPTWNTTISQPSYKPSRPPIPKFKSHNPKPPHTPSIYPTLPSPLPKPPQSLQHPRKQKFNSEAEKHKTSSVPFPISHGHPPADSQVLRTSLGITPLTEKPLDLIVKSALVEIKNLNRYFDLMLICGGHPITDDQCECGIEWCV